MMGETVAELAAARKHLANLKDRADRFRSEVDAAIGVLSDVMEVSVHRSRVSPSQENWPSYDDLMKLFREIKTTKKRIRGLQARLREWGAID